MYPHYVSIISLLIELIENSSDRQHLTDGIVTLIDTIEGNKDIEDEEREDLLYDVRDTM
jgi:hypothetical protein